MMRLRAGCFFSGVPRSPCAGRMATWGAVMCAAGMGHRLLRAGGKGRMQHVSMPLGATRDKAAILRAARPLLGLLVGLLVFDLYLFSGRIPIHFTMVPVSPLYVPVAVILAVLLLTPPRRWWLYLLVAYAFQVALFTGFGYPLGFNLVAELPTVFEPLIAAYLLYRLN